MLCGCVCDVVCDGVSGGECSKSTSLDLFPSLSL